MLPNACPKSHSALERAAKRAQRLRDARQMRDAVWARDKSLCRSCGRYLSRGDDWSPGHVHHIRGRRVAPEHLTNPDGCVLLCEPCHRGIHAGQIKVTGTTAETFRMA